MNLGVNNAFNSSRQYVCHARTPLQAFQASTLRDQALKRSRDILKTTSRRSKIGLQALAYGGGGHCAMATPSDPKN